jgi:hypothetical protein
MEGLELENMLRVRRRKGNRLAARRYVAAEAATS